MEIRKETIDKRKILIIGLLVLMLLGAASSYAYFVLLRPESEADTSETIPEETFESDRDQTEEIRDNPDTKDQAPNTDHPTPPNTPGESGKRQVRVIASTDQSGGTVYIRGGINQPVPDGICYALLSGPSNQSIRKESPILQNPASTDCKTIAIPASELGSGTWTFTLHFTSNEYEGASSEESFTL